MITLRVFSRPCYLVISALAFVFSVPLCIYKRRIPYSKELLADFDFDSVPPTHASSSGSTEPDIALTRTLLASICRVVRSLPVWMLYLTYTTQGFVIAGFLL